MIFIGKSPYRISLLGGGTDLDWFTKDNSYGLSLGYSLDMYSYTVINKLPVTSKYGILNYSSREMYQTNEEIVHPLIREAFKIVDLDILVELSSYGSASNGAGLGGSSSFLVSLLGALSKLLNISWSTNKIAEKASDVEIKKLSKPIGRQDQYLSSLGGISSLRFNKSGSVINQEISSEKDLLLRRLIKNFYLFPTATSRKADTILSAIKNDTSSKDKLLALRDIARQFIETKESREYVLEEKFHQSVKDSWEIKKSMNKVMNPLLEEQYKFLNKSLPNNWIRLLGAGGGGYFLVSLKEDILSNNSLENITSIKNYRKATLSEKGLEVSEF